MLQVQVIQPIQQQPKRLRVAAYARVSSDSTDQLNSLSVQVDYYTHLIQENPNWDFAGIYTDEGITGTSTKHREQFNRLMDDCRAGLIDRVLVKSASRFARNTADALTSVREMKSLGVTVVFEKEGFDTETASGEMILSMICATAQEESLSISKNLKWGIRKRMQDGTYLNGMSPFGYEKQESQLIPIGREAEIVRYIYSSFLVGVGTVQIAEELNRRYPKENGTWYVSAVRRIAGGVFPAEMERHERDEIHIPGHRCHLDRLRRHPRSGPGPEAKAGPGGLTAFAAAIGIQAQYSEWLAGRQAISYPPSSHSTTP